MKKSSPLAGRSRLQLKVTIDGHEFSAVGPDGVVSKQFNEFLALVADIAAKRYRQADDAPTVTERE